MPARLAALLLFVAGLVTALLPAAARADDIAATARGVVRVVTIAVVDGQVVGFGHGSGVAIAPGRIVTNAHVVELAQRYPDNVVIGIVPSQGSKSYRGKLIAYDTKRDLALIDSGGAQLPPAALYTGPSGEGDPVVALGYPGNVDLATARSAADYITPVAPVRSEGVFSGRRKLTGIEVLLHTASIARGNSGGPLLDRCGRVIGINSAITRGEEGDSTFGFAIADTELAGFLRDADQPYTAVGTPCTSIEERLRADSEAETMAATNAAEARRAAATDAGVKREERLARARADAERGRENVMALAALLLVGGALALGAAGLLVSRAERVPAIWTAGGGAAAIVASVLVFVFRPSGEVTLPADGAPTTSAAPEALGKLSCSFVPERSRVVTSATAPVNLDWRAGGCGDGKPFVEANGGWERIEAPDADRSGDQTATLNRFDPATRTYSATRFFLDADAMAALRRARGPAAAACSTDPAAEALLRGRQAAMRALLPPLPNEKLVYRCQSDRTLER